MGFTTENFDLFKNANDKYMNFPKGESRFRILSDNIVGWEDWKDNKPVRYRITDHPKAPKPVDSTKPVKPFMSMIVWNYNDEKIQILQIKQMSVIKELQSFIIDPDWGQPYFYDLKVTKSGDGMQTKYSVKPVAHKDTAKEIIQAFKETPIWLEALFEGNDPFDDHPSTTPGVFEKEMAFDVMSKQQAFELDDLLASCEPSYAKKVFEGMVARYKTNNVNQWPANLFKELKDKCSKNIEDSRIARAS